MIPNNSGATEPAPQLVVVGCPSIDRLVAGEVEVEAPGGAGFNTALAARATGISVGLVAAIPRDLPRVIATAFASGGLNRAGLVVREGIMPSFHICYDEDQNASYLGAELGVEKQLTADDMPESWLDCGFLHVSPLGTSARTQLDFISRIRERGFAGHLSAGCYLNRQDPDVDLTLEVISHCSLVFMNRFEADTIYPDGPPSDGIVRCVTQGESGAAVYSGSSVVHRGPKGAKLVDPTGAGDAFSGGYLAAHINNEDALDAGLAAASRAIAGWGSMALIEAVVSKCEPRVVVDAERTSKISEVLSSQAKDASIDFCGFPFPEANEAHALDCLALATAHQYGFWHSDNRGWVGSMYAEAQGERFKGSDFIWQAFTRAVRQDPTVLDPRRLASEPDLFEQICLADDGRCPVPELDSHSALQQAYGSALVNGGYASFAELLAESTSTGRPGAQFLARLSHLPGFAEDSLAKKANLLLVILAKRPEGFVDLLDPESITPIVDYHLMRSCLRTGCITVTDSDLLARIESRSWVDEVEESEIRSCAFEAINQLVEKSGLTQAAVDGFFFVNARKYCVEVGKPDCESCTLRSVCAQQLDAFQPVIRTTAY